MPEKSVGDEVLFARGLAIVTLIVNSALENDES